MFRIQGAHHQVYFASYVEYSRETPKIMSFVNFQSGTGQKSKKYSKVAFFAIFYSVVATIISLGKIVAYFIPI